MSLNLYIQIELGEVYIILYFLGSVWGAPWWKDVALLKSMKNETSLRKKKRQRSMENTKSQLCPVHMG